jgi:2,4-dienoyl-CoA reductase-like NADH-dependent reductase (Old Yellow Enzyme family)
MSYFTALKRGNTRLGVAGKVTSSAIAAQMLDQGADYVLIGRAAILHHDFPRRAQDPAFTQVPIPGSAAYLRDQAVSPSFVEYLRNTFKMVEPEAVEA